jgi:hypothetical protein
VEALASRPRALTGPCDSLTFPHYKKSRGLLGEIMKKNERRSKLIRLLEFLRIRFVPKEF